MSLSSQLVNYLASPLLSSAQGYLAVELESLLLSKAQRPVRSYITYTPKDAKSPSKLVFHVMIDAQHTFESRVTEYPVETGTNITDHVSHSNPTFSVRAMFSKATEPFLANEKDGGVVSQEDAYKILTSLRTDRTAITLRTPLDSFSDLIITNLTFPKSIDEGRSLYVDISFQQIRKISTATTTVDVTVKKSVNKAVAKGNKVKDSCTPKTNEGAKPPDTTTGSASTDDRILNNFTKLVKNLRAGIN